MSRHAAFPRLAALALLVAPGFVLAGSEQPSAKCAHPCACRSHVKEARTAPQPSDSKQAREQLEEQQRIWTSP